MDFCVSVFTLPRAEAVELELLVVCLCVRNGEKSLYLWNEFYFHQGLTNQIFKFLQLKEPCYNWFIETNKTNNINLIPLLCLQNKEAETFILSCVRLLRKIFLCTDS